MPTMTTSVFSVAMAYPLPTRALGRCLQADDGRARERLLALQIRRRENRLRAGKADQAPAREVLVAAVERVGEHAFHRVRPKGVEELLRQWDR